MSESEPLLFREHGLVYCSQLGDGELAMGVSRVSRLVG